MKTFSCFELFPPPRGDVALPPALSGFPNRSREARGAHGVRDGGYVVASVPRALAGNSPVTVKGVRSPRCSASANCAPAGHPTARSLSRTVADPQTGVAPSETRGRNVRSKCR